MAGVNVQFLQHGLAQLLGHSLRVDIQDGTAHDDGLVEQSFGLRHAEQGAHLSAAARLTENSDVCRVAAKLPDVFLNPFQRLYHVEHAHVAGVLVFRRASRKVEEAQNVQAVVDAHHHHVFLGQLHAGVPCRRARVESAAMQPHHHGFATLRVGRPHVQHARIFLRHLGLAQLASPSVLHRLGSPVVTHSHRIPLVHRLRGHETFHLGIRNATEAHCSFVVETFHQSRFRAYHHRVSRL